MASRTAEKVVEESEEELPKAKRTSRGATNIQLERLYEESSARILQERNDFFLPQVRDFVTKERWVNLRPEYQRRHRWDKKKQSRLIESLLMNVPVPPVFLYEKELNRYEVMDGQQRLVSLLDFYSNKLALTGLEAWSGLNGRKYRSLPPKLQRGLDRRRISAVVLLAESSAPTQIGTTDIRREVFSRLNTGGTALNVQELRNCIFAGPFNDLIIALAGTMTFKKMWGMPTDSPKSLRENLLYQTMGDCQIVLRFFALRDAEKIRGSVKRMLDQCMRDHQNSDAKKLRQFRADFISRLKVVHQIFGTEAFLLPKKIGDRHSRPLFDALMISVDRLWEQRNALVRNRLELRKRLGQILARPKTYELIVGRPNTADAVKARISLVERMLSATV
jgi:hypothetical protein